ncbi:hypothetical protein C2845_PM11G19410 [Panicum miliaceum]|uniref:Uncharacterized protein n=1 Tax=Panicum miliaceum TaxID=4540 RepID=A0A3L6RX37_PANMI|nr:hypothetical protein C2845_PM11G19410 [Panicum miliaceum]
MEQPLLPMLLELTVVVTLLVLALSHLVSSRRSPPPRRLPPSPPGLPVIGHLHLLRPPVHRTFHELAARLGPLMLIRLGSTGCVVASSADVARELIHGHDATISGRPITALARLFSYGFAFTTYGPQWRLLRRLCVSEVLGPRTVEQLRPVRRASLVLLLRAVLAAAARGEAADLTRELIRFSNASIIRMVASDAPGSVADEAQDLVKAVTGLIGAFNVEDYVPLCRGWDLQGLRREAAGVHRRFDALLEKMIRHKEEARDHGRAAIADDDEHEQEDRKQAPATRQRNKDLLDILLEKADDDAAEMKLTRENIKAFITDVVTAGSDSSAATVEWMLAELMNHPEAMRKAAFKETLRLHPGAPIAHRMSTGEMVVRGFTVPPRTAVFINVWAIGRDPAFWEDPLASCGGGRRGCPGVGLAQQSVPAALAALVQCFDWAVADGETGLVDMDESDVGLVCARKHPLLLRPTARLNPFPAVE